MPNWCWNNLTVSGNEKQLHEFVEKSLVSTEKNEIHDAIEFTFDGTHPMPQQLNITRGTQTQGEEKQALFNKTKYGYTDWYEWHIGEWGTKWDAVEPHLNHNDKDYFSVTFDTAWSPPLEWIQNIMHKFPDLSFILEYEESGMGFGGKLTAQHNEIWDNFSYDLDQASECCEAKVYNSDDEEFTLPEKSNQELSTWVGEDKTWKTLEDIPVYHKYPDHQCGVCGEECETISMNEADVKPAKIKVNETNEN